MTFQTALDFHVNFTLSMMRYCKNPDGSLDPNEVAKPDICALGKWIESQRETFGSDSQFDDLEKAHVDFHVAAAGVVRKVNSGLDATADVAVGSPSAYGQASSVLANVLNAFARRYRD